jgi:hypothetical protein
LHGGSSGGKCRLAKETIARGFSSARFPVRIVASYGAYGQSVFLNDARRGLSSGNETP